MLESRTTVGQVTEVNILTVTKRRWWPFQRLNFFIARRSLWASEHLIRQTGLSLQLKRLNFIHAARWVALGRFPSAGLERRERESARFRWVLFLSNFNQGWKPYLLAFLDSFATGVNTIWGESDGMPDFPMPGTRYETMAWIDGQLPPSRVYYAAYPEASTNDVRSALRVTRELEANGIADHAPYRTLPTALRRSLQPCLIPIEAPAGERRTSASDWLPPAGGWPPSAGERSPAGERPRDGERPPSAGPDRYDGHAGMVACFPIRPGQVVALERDLDEDGAAWADRFREVGGVHFARLFVIDRLRPTPGTSQRLKNSWLVMSLVFDTRVAQAVAAGRRGGGLVDRLIRRDPQMPQLPDHIVADIARRIHRGFGQEGMRIWDHCRATAGSGSAESGSAESGTEESGSEESAGPSEGGIDEDTFVEMVRVGAVPNLVAYADYPDVTLDRVQRSLDRHRRLMATAALT